MPKSETELTFEAAMKRLNTIVQDMESDEMPLESLLTSYEEGIQLVKACQARLANAQQRLEIIQQNAAKELETKPFDPASAAKPEAARSSARDANLF